MNIRRQAAAALQKGDTTYTRQQKRMGWAGRREARARADGRAKERPREDTDGEKRKQQGGRTSFFKHDVFERQRRLTFACELKGARI